MIGTELKDFGLLISNKELKLVHVDLKAGHSIAPHDHKGQDVFFTLIRGSVTVSLDGEKHQLTPGTVLNFAGEHFVGIEAREDSEFFVYLINRQG